MAKRRQRTNSNVPAKGRLRDMADQLWSFAVRDDWGWKCAVCWAGKCEAHHLVPRQHETTRYSLRNGIALCSRHHQFDPDVSPHQNAAGWIDWLEREFPGLAAWYLKNKIPPEFEGTKNAAYYCEVIRDLRQYVDEETFRGICGQKFSEWLARNTD